MRRLLVTKVAFNGGQLISPVEPPAIAVDGCARLGNLVRKGLRAQGVDGDGLPRWWRVIPKNNSRGFSMRTPIRLVFLQGEGQEALVSIPIHWPHPTNEEIRYPSPEG